MQIGLILISVLSTISVANAGNSTANIEFIAPTIPKIEKPACVKVDLIKTEKVNPNWTSNEAEPLKLTYLVTFHMNCEGVITLTSMSDSRSNHHTETIKQSYRLSGGKLQEMK